jgi:hypothetical protein
VGSRLKTGAKKSESRGQCQPRRVVRPTGLQLRSTFFADSNFAHQLKTYNLKPITYNSHISQVPATKADPTLITAMPRISCGVSLSRKKSEAATAIMGRSIASIG